MSHANEIFSRSDRLIAAKLAGILLQNIWITVLQWCTPRLCAQNVGPPMHSSLSKYTASRYTRTSDFIYARNKREAFLTFAERKSEICIARDRATNQWRTEEFFFGGFNKFSWGQRQRGRGSGGGSPLVRGSGGSCNLVQEISFHIVKFS